MKSTKYFSLRRGLSPRLGLISSSIMVGVMALGSLCAQTIHFDALKAKGGRASESAFVRVGETGIIATVVALESDMQKATLDMSGKKWPLTLLCNERNSRLALYQLREEDRSKVTFAEPSVTIASSKLPEPATPLYLSPKDHKKISRMVSRITHFQGKVLPLAVYRINHGEAAPQPGTGVYDAEGKLIGLVRQTVYNEPSSSFTLPAQVITRSLADVKKNKRVSRCWIGIVMDELVDPPIVETVRPESPAEKAGLKIGDIINKIDDVNVNSMANLLGYLRTKRPGDVIKVHVLRDGDENTIDVKLNKNNAAIIKSLGISIKNTTPNILKSYGITNGVYIDRVNNRLLYQNGIRPGNIITAINGTKIVSVDDAITIIDNLQHQRYVLEIVSPDGLKNNYIFQ